MEKLISTIPKSASEEIHVGLAEFKTNGKTLNMVYARAFYQNGEEFKPGKNGLNIKIELLPDLITALQETEREALNAGLLSGESEAA